MVKNGGQRRGGATEASAEAPSVSREASTEGMALHGEVLCILKTMGRAQKDDSNRQRVERKHKISSAIALGLALLFNRFFMFTKHDPALSAIIPFAADPYDAIGSFGMIISVWLAILSVFRAFRPYRTGSPSALRSVFRARTQIATALAVLVPLGADGIAMGRYPSPWAGKPAAGQLLALVLGMVALSFAVIFMVRRSSRGIQLPAVRKASRNALIVVPVSFIFLWLYPEDAIRAVWFHLSTIAIGVVLLVVSQAVLAVALVPYDTAEAGFDEAGAAFQTWPSMDCDYGARSRRWCFFVDRGDERR
jgi:hypothetical protein